MKTHVETKYIIINKMYNGDGARNTLGKTHVETNTNMNHPDSESNTATEIRHIETKQCTVVPPLLSVPIL